MKGFTHILTTCVASVWMLSKRARYALALRFLETDDDIRGAELASSRRLVIAPEMAGDARAVAHTTVEPPAMLWSPGQKEEAQPARADHAG